MDAPQEKQKISGYTYGTAEVAKSPITMEEWKSSRSRRSFPKRTFLPAPSEEVLADQVGDLLKTWRGYHLRSSASRAL